MHCQKCKTTEKLIKNSINKNNGRISYICRDCNTEKHRKYRQTKKGKKNIFNAVYKSIKKYPQKHNARVKLFYRIKIGDIIKPKICSVCNSKEFLFAHHSDYSKPLEVMWVCRNCHMEIHRKII